MNITINVDGLTIDSVVGSHYDDESEQPGIAEVILAKHRNGPTDTVPLTFLPHLTQFRNHAIAAS